MRWVTFAWRLALSTLRVSVRGLTDHVISVVWGKMHVKVSFGLCVIGFVRVAFGALSAESQCSWTVVLNC